MMATDDDSTPSSAAGAYQYRNCALSDLDRSQISMGMQLDCVRAQRAR
jgi:hypothetical protein